MANFIWSDYLESSKSEALPEELFPHVELSLNNGISQGMLLEVCHKSNPDVYWIAEITLACGHFLRIKFLGAKEEFWINVGNTKVHPLGWCGKYDELIEPPEEINYVQGDKIIDIMKAALMIGVSVSEEILKNKGLSPIDRIKPGMKVEVQNTLDPYKYWIATICENKGGRLLLKYDGSEDDLGQFWIFYSNPRLYGFGFVTNKGSPWQFKYPGKVNRFSCRNKLSFQLRQCAEEAIKDPTPVDLFQINMDMDTHSFVTGMKLEAMDPQNMQSVHPATVTKVFNNFHFLVVLDDHLEDYQDTKMAMVCHSGHHYIYPVGWAHKNFVQFKPPKIWTEGTFDWDEYLNMTASVPAPDHFFIKKEYASGIEINMKLEAVNPRDEEEVHVANVFGKAEHMLCVELLPIREKFWYSQDSDLLFPVGWCDSNKYDLLVPDLNALIEEEAEEVIEPKEVIVKKTEEWCERIYFNYKCYAGPMISRNKLSQLPKHVGPGPLLLVLKEVLNKIISASYKPAKLLKDCQVEQDHSQEGMRLEMLKAKLKSSTYHALVPVATSLEQVPSFCRDFCAKLQACPSLFGPAEYPVVCPETCQQGDKSRFLNNGEKRRTKGSGRKKRRKAPEKPKPPSQDTALEKEKEVNESPESEHSAGSNPASESGTRPNSPDSNDSKKHKKDNTKKKNPKMKTRGAKLPNFTEQIKESNWNKKDVDTIYNNSYVSKNKGANESDTENDSRSTNSRDIKHISDVSDGEEPELKKLKFSSADEPQPSDNKMFEKNTVMSWVKTNLKLSPNPIDWSVEDVHKYLSNTEDCKLIADKMKHEQIDGQAFIMLDLPVIIEFLHMKRDFALRLCKHVTMVKWYYIVNYGADS